MESVTPDPEATSRKPQVEETKTVSIRKVPVSIWLQVRQNALRSRMSFQDYLTMVLADAEPYPVSGERSC